MEKLKRTFTFDGNTRTVIEWCSELGISTATWYIRQSQFKRGKIAEAEIFRGAVRQPGRKATRIEYQGEKHTVGQWAKKLGIEPVTFRNRMSEHRRAPDRMTIEAVFTPGPVRPKGRTGPGRTAKIYQYKHNGKVYAMTANEWSFQLDLRSRDTFYNRIKSFERNPRVYPLSWVFRCAPSAPWAKRNAQRFAEAAAMPADEQAKVLAVVRAELGDINAPLTPITGKVAEDVRPKLAPITVVPDDL